MASKYQWEFLHDDPNLKEQIVEFVADLIVRGKNTTEINRALNDPFPGIDYITCGKFKKLAFKYICSLADKIDKSKYIAKSIHRLERLMANDYAKDKTILAADLQLTNLLGLADAQEMENPEEQAAKIRAALAEMDLTIGQKPKEEDDKPDVPSEQKQTESKEATDKSSEGSQTPKEAIIITKEEELELRKARARRLREDIKDATK